MCEIVEEVKNIYEIFSTYFLLEKFANSQQGKQRPMILFLIYSKNNMIK